MKYYGILSILILIGVCFFWFKESNVSYDLSVGVIVPSDYGPLNEIASGFISKLSESSKDKKTKIFVQNAHGDASVQRSIIKQFISKKIDLFVPVATQATEATLSVVKEKPVLFLAAFFDNSIKDRLNNITGITDDMPLSDKVTFIHEMVPNAKNIALVYSNSEKVVPEVSKIDEAASQYNIKFKKYLVQNVREMASVSKTINNVDAIVVLRDIVVLSGMQNLVKNAAERLAIPIVTFNEDAVNNGAVVSIGTTDRMIGEIGASVALKILAGADIKNIPISPAKPYTVFVNNSSLQKQSLDKNLPVNYANKNGYQITFVEK